MAHIAYHNYMALTHNGLLALQADVLRWILVGPGYVQNTDHTVLADIGANELPLAGGYVPGGVVVVGTVTDVDASDWVTFTTTVPMWNCVGAVGPFRYGILYDATFAAGALIYCADWGMNVIYHAADVISITPAAGGLLRIRFP